MYHIVCNLVAHGTLRTVYCIFSALHTTHTTRSIAHCKIYCHCTLHSELYKPCPLTTPHSALCSLRIVLLHALHTGHCANKLLSACGQRRKLNQGGCEVDGQQCWSPHCYRATPLKGGALAHRASFFLLFPLVPVFAPTSQNNWSTFSPCLRIWPILCTQFMTMAMVVVGSGGTDILCC